MATHYFTGECKWARVQTPDEKYKKYSIDVKLDEKAMYEYGNLKLKGKPREGFVTFSSYPDKKNGGPAKKPEVVDAEGNPCDALIGNGSNVTVKVETYSYNNEYGKGNGSRLVAVKVNELKEYVKEAAVVPQDSSETKSPPRPKILF
jgi:hypothetical protein